jgi:LytS/YehU family sensor histidine kinase
VGHEADHSLPSSAKVKNEWSYTSVFSLFAFMAWTGIVVSKVKSLLVAHQELAKVTY